MKTANSAKKLPSITSLSVCSTSNRASRRDRLQTYRKVCPSDIEQQEGRIIRQGNQNKQVYIYRYITKGSFDAYNWQLLEQKQKFISQIMTSKSPVRSAEDIDSSALSFAEVKALAAGDPNIKEKMQLDNEVSRLKIIKANFQSTVYQMEDDIAVNFPRQIADAKCRIAALEHDLETAKALGPVNSEDPLEVTIGGKTFSSNKEAGLAIIAACAGLKEIKTGGEIGSIGGFRLIADFDSFRQGYNLTVQSRASRTIEVSKDPYANIRRIKAVITDIPNTLAGSRQQLALLEQQLENAKQEVHKPFPQEAELQAKLERLSELNRLLNSSPSQNARKSSDIVAEKPPKPSIRDRLRNARTQDRPENCLPSQHKKLVNCL